MKTTQFEGKSVDDILKLLNASINGLTEAEAETRTKIYGLNEVPEERRNRVIEFFSGYWGPMPWLLEMAMGLSFLLGHFTEAVTVFILLTINVVVGFHHAQSSQQAIEYLKKRLTTSTRVLRDGEWVTRNSSEIVPGDVISLGLGNLVPADAILVGGQMLVDQSTVTGESLPVELQHGDRALSGTTVTQGKARCVVIATGANSYSGTTTELVKIAQPTSHQEKVILEVTRYMMYFGLAATILVMLWNIVQGSSVMSVVTFAAIFLIGAVPVALPAVLTTVQSVGSMQMARRDILVARLDSVEDAALLDVLCLDKTGTLTQNKLSIVSLIAASPFNEEEVATMAALASDEETNDLIDLLIIEHAKQRGINLSSYSKKSFTPFAPLTKRAEAIVESNEGEFRVVKGAVQSVSSICTKIDDATIKWLNSTEIDLAQRGYRTLAVARSVGDEKENLRCVGIISMSDPIRPDSLEMVETIKSLRVKPLMLTGDRLDIAKEIATAVGVGDSILAIESIRGKGEKEQLSIIEQSNGFAQIFPEDKYRIVKLLQSSGHIVGMTGDGVNDAPALKQAELGVAVNNATDVAKASASVVLTKDGLGVLVDALKISRYTYQRLLSWVINKVTKVIQFIGVLTIGFLWLNNLMISLLGMVLLVFANDFATMSLATDNVKHSASPNTWNVRNITIASLPIGLLLVIQGVIVVYIGISVFQLDFESLQSFLLLTLIFTSQCRVLIVRERGHFWSSMPGKGLLASVSAVTLVFVLVGVYGILIFPLAFHQILFSLVFSLLFTFALDPLKYWLFKKMNL
jgi:H+-transporting ATPase